MTKRNPEFGGFSACFAVRAETDRKGKATPPARTETAMCEPVDWIYSDFNPLRPRGRRHLLSGPICVQFKISTHSAREDGDCVPLTIGVALQEFQPTPPARTETKGFFLLQIPLSYFNPLRPQGRRRCLYRNHLVSKTISTHSARKDGDCNTTQKTNNSSSHFHNQITSYSLKSPPTYPAHIQNRSHCAVFPVRIPP